MRALASSALAHCDVALRSAITYLLVTHVVLKRLPVQTCCARAHNSFTLCGALTDSEVALLVFEVLSFVAGHTFSTRRQMRFAVGRLCHTLVVVCF